MSSFNCIICNTPNIDSTTGYISGCIHYPPDKTGIYLCFITYNKNDNTKQRLRYDCDKDEWAITDKHDIHHWEIE